MIAPEMKKHLPMASYQDMVPMLEAQLQALDANIMKENDVISKLTSNKFSFDRLVSYNSFFY